MTPGRSAAACFSFLLASAGALWAGVNQELLGTWTGVQGGTAAGVAFRIEPDGTCVIGQETGKCQTTLGTLSYTGSQGLSKYTWKIKDDVLTISRKGAIPMVFRRQNLNPAPVSTAPGGPYTQQPWGVTFEVPPGWKVAEADTMLLLGSDTEPGLIIVRFMNQATREALLSEYNAGLQDNGVSLPPAIPAQPFAAKTRTGIAGEFAGTNLKGERLKARMIGVLTGYGDAVIFVGVTGEQQYPTVKTRVDWIANSVTFKQPM
jgi:hypothetical protein